LGSAFTLWGCFYWHLLFPALLNLIDWENIPVSERMRSGIQAELVAPFPLRFTDTPGIENV
jgi:hypothetical protein